MKITDCKIIEKVFKKDRWYVVLNKPFNGRKQIPYAHYVWLDGNPSFKNVPKGYVIHHLDWDETNDDISNLVLMQKYHHISHHWKNKKVVSPIKIIPAKEYFPTRKPTVLEDKHQNRFVVQFYEKINGGTKQKKLFSHGNLSGFKSRKDAEKVIYEIWGQYQKNFELMSNDV